MLEASHHYRSRHAIWDHTELTATLQRQRLTPLHQPVIYTPSKDERQSRIEPTACPESLQKCWLYTRSQLIKLAFCPTGHSRCEQLAHSVRLQWDSNPCLSNTCQTRYPFGGRHDTNSMRQCNSNGPCCMQIICISGNHGGTLSLNLTDWMSHLMPNWQINWRTASTDKGRQHKNKMAKGHTGSKPKPTVNYNCWYVCVYQLSYTFLHRRVPIFSVSSSRQLSLFRYHIQEAVNQIRQEIVCRHHTNIVQQKLLISKHHDK